MQCLNSQYYFLYGKLQKVCFAYMKNYKSQLNGKHLHSEFKFLLIIDL